MNPLWSQIARELSPYVPGEQPRITNLVKLNTNESPFGPSPLALEAMRVAATDTLRLYPDPEATELREALATHHGVKPEQVFVGNGSDEVLAHAFVALLKQPKPLLFPDVTLQLLSRVGAIARACLRDGAGGRRNARQGRGLSARGGVDRDRQSQRADRHRGAARADRPAARRSSGHPGGDRRGLCRLRWRERGSADRRTPKPAGRTDDVEVARPGGLARRLCARGRGTDRGAAPRERQLQFLPAWPRRPGRRDGFGSRRSLLPRELRQGRRGTRSEDAGAVQARLRCSAFEREFRLRPASIAGRAGIRLGAARTCGAGAAFQQAAHGALSAHYRWYRRRCPTANRGSGGYPEDE